MSQQKSLGTPQQHSGTKSDARLGCFLYLQQGLLLSVQTNFHN